MSLMNILKVYDETFADGPGMRMAIYVSGCEHKCKGCHNPQSWDFNQGTPYQEKLPEIIKTLKNNTFLTGVTISGGDPLNPNNTSGVLDMLKQISAIGKNIWVYTGYTIEELLAGTDEQQECLTYIDTLVDGRFVEEQREFKALKGSANQRFVQAKQAVSH